MKGDKLGRQGGTGSQERNHEGRQVWETSWQGQPSFTDKAAVAAKSEIMKKDRQGGSGSQERNHEGRQA